MSDARSTALRFAALLLLGAGAGAHAASADTPPPPALASTPSHRTHPLRGEIVRLNSTRRTLLVRHEEIPGYMPAMTMEFTAPAADFTALREGQLLSATMIEAAPGQFRLEQLIIQSATDPAVLAAARDLRTQTLARGNRPTLRDGETAPAFTLYDQEGSVVSFTRFRGRRVILNFIYTRCPIPTMCSAATARLAALQKLVREKALPDVAFVSISLDPVHDTPPVLKSYAATHGADLANWSFLTGPESAVRDLLTQFGVIAIPSGNFYAHSLATILVGRDGKLALRLDDNSPDWTPADFITHLTPP
jgi:protein SCO1/2